MACRSALPSNITEVELNPFLLYSWTLDEYIAAIAVEGLWEKVKDVMDSSVAAGVETETTNEDLLMSKYHFAGGSCRFMFQNSTKEVIHSINEAISKTPNLRDVAETNVGDSSVAVVNRLFSRYEDDENEQHIISAFALRSIAIRCGPNLIKQMIRITNASNNPSLLGELLEIWFFHAIASGDISLIDRKSNKEEHWNASKHVWDFDPESITDKSLFGEPAWYKPEKFNQGGYDVVYVDRKKGVTRFVQVSKAKAHSFKIHYFRALLDRFRKHTTHVTKELDICFVIPIDNMKTFEISPVQGMGLLNPFGSKWATGSETESARVLGIMNFNTNSI
jgi:hypothetical protein